MESIMENISETELLKLMDCCRLCLSQSPSRISLLTKERLGMTLLEMVNSLTGLHLNEISNSLMVCLNCAGKIVNLHEFRDLCQMSDKKFSRMEMALRLKRMQNSSRMGMSLNLDDDDMQIFYVCKVCKVTFDGSKIEEYKEHKKQHVLNGEMKAHSTPVKQEGERKKPGRKKKSVSVVVETEEYHQQDPSPDSKSSSNRRSRRASVPKHSFYEESVSEKIYDCSVCDKTFVNKRARHAHTLKAHGFTVKSQQQQPTKYSHTKSPQNSETKQFSCRYCNKIFDKRYSKYNHERVCLKKDQHIEQQQNDHTNDSEVIEQETSVEPIVELTEDDVSNNDMANYDGAIKCYRCPEEFNSGRARSTHEKNVHNLSISECRICGKDFSTYPNRYQHQRRCEIKNSINFSENYTNGQDDANDEQDDEEEDVVHTGFQTAFVQSL